jgi:UDP-N-acetylmuramyl pentapeptide phosphotransferase/UDP-N-acetylglucosamine-1-phosphate transferase
MTTQAPTPRTYGFPRLLAALALLFTVAAPATQIWYGGHAALTCLLVAAVFAILGWTEDLAVRQSRARYRRSLWNVPGDRE